MQAPSQPAVAANEAAAESRSPGKTNQATIRITRKAAEYAVANGQRHHRDQNQVLPRVRVMKRPFWQTSEDGGENALLFATGAYCEVVGVNKENDCSYVASST